MLTAAKARAAEPGDRPYKLADGGGLFLQIFPSGLRSWRMGFRFGGRAKLLVFGRFPDMTLAQARDRRDAARGELRAGRDPSGARQRAIAAAEAERVATTFETVARAWHAQQRRRWSDVHAADVLASLERHVFPAIGATPPASIDTAAVLRVVRAIEAAGAIETARRVRQRISRIFRRAIAEQLATLDPAAIAADALEQRPEVRRQAALLDLHALRAAYAAIGTAAAPRAAVQAAQLVALTAVRTAVARGARWEEFEDLEPRWGVRAGEPSRIDQPIWRVPAARMKLKRARKADAANDHLVPLSPAAVELLRAARAAAGSSPLVFPARAGGSALIGANSILAVHRAAGLAGRHSPHGWRAAFSTVMNERDPADRGAIDLALAHAPAGPVEAAYNRAQLLGPRRRILQTWADLMTGRQTPEDAREARVALIPG